MAHKQEGPGQAAYEYIAANSVRYPSGVEALIEATEQGERAGMATAPVQAQFLAFLIKAIDAKRVIEVGVFTGITTLWMADAVGEGGQVVACDISDEYPAIGKPFWEQAGVADRIDLRIAPADQTLQQLAAEGQTGTFDLVYIDADKQPYDTYYELTLPLLRCGGIVGFDNMLRGGRVMDKANDDPAVVAIRDLNTKLHHDDRVDISFLPICDGLNLARKR
jgi:predicted O-methyltransferase YrrM